MTDYADLEKRLREFSTDYYTPYDLLNEAADAIAALCAALGDDLSSARSGEDDTQP